MIEVYFDESGTHHQFPAVAIGACLAKDTEWVQFDSKWAAVLKAHSTEKFHATEFERRFVPYDKWKEAECISFQDELIDVFKAHVKVIITVATQKEDYQSYRKSDWDYSPYYYTLCQAIYGVARWADDYAYAGDIAYIFSEGADDRELRRLERDIHRNSPLKNRLRLARWERSSPKKLTQLQAADMIAYETFKELKHYAIPDSPIQGTRPSMEKIMTGIHVYDRFYCKALFTDADSIG
jgi:hypothetical protein